MNKKTKKWHNWYVIIVPAYIFIYTIASIWLLIDGWINQFSSIHVVWSTTTLPPHVQNLFFTMLGALLGCAILGITSFHRYKAIEKTFDIDHIWGFFLAPVLALVVGLLIYAILQSGLVVLTNQTSLTSITPQSNITATLGYLAIGGITGYNWDVFIKKLQELSANIMNTPKESEQSNSRGFEHNKNSTTSLETNSSEQIVDKTVNR